MKGNGRVEVILLLVVVLLAGCGGGDDASGGRQPGSGPDTTSAPIATPTSQPAPVEGFPTMAFAELSEKPLSAKMAAMLQRTIDDAAGDNGVTAALMTSEGTWTGAAGTADGDRTMRPEAQMAIGSITKTIIAAQVMQLVEAGRVYLDDPAADHLPRALEFDTNDATVGDLLAMRSGIPDYVDALYRGLSTHTRHVWTAEEMLDLVPPRRSPAGAEFDYSSTNYLLLGLILEHATGRPVARTLRDGVLDGPGFARLVYQPDERPTDPMASPGGGPALSTSQGGGYLPSLAGATAAGPAGGMASDSATLARWWGRLCAGRIVSETSLDTMTEFDQPAEYGLGINDWSAQDGPFAVGNEGLHVGFTSRAECLPEQGIVVVVLNNNDEGADLESISKALIGAIPSR